MIADRAMVECWAIPFQGDLLLLWRYLSVTLEMGGIYSEGLRI